MTIRQHEGCTHGPGTAWTTEASRRWFARCDTCDAFRPWADYFEIYASRKGWWWECERCLITTATASAECNAEKAHTTMSHAGALAEALETEHELLMQKWGEVCRKTDECEVWCLLHDYEKAKKDD